MVFGGGNRARPTPLQRPDINRIPAPDGSLLNKRSRAEALSLIEDAYRLMEGGWGLERANELLRQVLPRMITDPPEIVESTAQAVGRFAHFGIALAEVERLRGWERPGQTDGRVRMALVLRIAMSPDVPGDTLGLLATYLAQAGYWVARMGERGLVELCVGLPSRDV
jgi:hypothetical protein